MTNYTALVRKEPRSDYSVDFPDFPGCVTAGRTLEEARETAREALEGHIEMMREEGLEVPEPSSLDEIMRHREHRDATAILVTVATGRPPSVRVNISVPLPELRKIDALAKRLGKTRSSLLVDAALARGPRKSSAR